MCALTHPPLRVEDGEAEVVNDTVVVLILVWRDLSPNRKALQAQVKVRADGTLYAGYARNVLGAIVAMVQSPAARCMPEQVCMGFECCALGA